ncbi:putative protein FAR1-RELATED SEQUENCE 10 isoform X1 [Henckelia pumila]|uniref:putative protein FAR1-RELATED SEQUENCE 10 isoform X1 n=1 Tax=Henckelia pumila TaxID=405737 RepID=UPI003C6E63B3
MDVEQMLDVGDERIEASVLEDIGTCEADLSGEPYEGMIFDSEDAARMFYDEYAGRMGFFTRILSSRKSERDGSIISRGLGCRGNRDVQSPGKRRGGCTSMLIVKRENVGRWVVRKFVRDHNHPLVVSSPKKRPTFDEKDKKIQDLTAELRLKKRLSAAYREQLLILIKDVENHNDNLTAKLQTIHSKLKEIEAKRHELSNH